MELTVNFAVAALLVAAVGAAASDQPAKEWPIARREPARSLRSWTRGRPAAPPPSDAIVLFDGKDLAKWRAKGRRPARSGRSRTATWRWWRARATSETDAGLRRLPAPRRVGHARARRRARASTAATAASS